MYYKIYIGAITLKYQELSNLVRQDKNTMSGDVLVPL